MPDQLPESSRSAIRLTFSFDGRAIEVVLREPVKMMLPPSAPLDDTSPRSAFWFELQDAGGKPLYRRSQRNPLDPRIEVRTGNPENPLAWVDSGRRSGTFTLLVPDLAAAEAVVLFDWAAPGKEVREPVRVELARFPFGKAIDEAMVRADKIPPTTVSDAVASYSRVAEITLRAFDNIGPVARTVYRVDDGDEQEGLRVRVDKAGKHQLAFWSIDPAGNVEAENVVSFTVHRRQIVGR